MRVLAIVAHPDDETLGCGGMLARHAAWGHPVSVMTCTDGVSSRSGPGALASRITRRRQFFEAMEILGLSWARTDDWAMVGLDWHLDRATGAGFQYGSADGHEFGDNRMDQEPLLRVTKQVELAIERYGPDVIYTHHVGDLNVDHRVVAQAVVTATRPAQSNVMRVLSFEVPSSTEWAYGGPTPFVPNFFAEIPTAAMRRKVDAFDCYRDEVRLWPHPRSLGAIHALATYRGTTIGAGCAEAFMLLREVVR